MIIQQQLLIDDKMTMLSSFAAESVDEIYKGDPDSYLGSAVQVGLIRLVSVIVFPIFAAIDLLRLSTHALIQKGRSIVPYDTQEDQALYSIQAHKTSKLALGMLLGIVCSPLGLLYSDIVTNHFLQPQTLDPTLLAPYGQYATSRPLDRFLPNNPQEVQEIVGDAIKNGHKITISGAGMSQGAQTLPMEGEEVKSINIDMRNLNQVEIITANQQGKSIARVGAGATWQDVQREADKHGLAVQVMQASNLFSIGGSLGTNVHGWDHKMGTLIETVQSITLVTPQGDLVKFTREDEQFQYAIGGFGLFGVIVEAELELTENEELIEHSEKVSPEDYVDYFDNHVLNDEDISMHLYRLSLDPNHLLEEGVAVSYQKPNPNLGLTHTPRDLYNEPKHGTLIDRICVHVARRSLGPLRALYWWHESNRLLKNEYTIQTRNEIMRPPIEAIFNESKATTEWLQEYFVNKDELPAFLKKLGGTLMKNNVGLLNASVRYVKKDTKKGLNYAPEDRFAIVLFFSQPLSKSAIQRTVDWTGEMIDYLREENRGTYYLPYQPTATREQFETCYPEASQFAQKKNELDGDHTFASGFFQKYIQPINNN